MKKTLFALFLILFSLSAAFALDGIVTWTWYENDPDVQYYRYQVDGEDDGRWIVVDSWVNEVSLTLDVSVIHTLYLQQSYDGELWSESSATDSEIFLEEETDEYQEYEEWEEETVEEEIPEEEEDGTVYDLGPAEEEIYYTEAVEIEVYKPITFIDFGFGYMDFIPDTSGPKTLGIFGSYFRTFTKAGIFDIGVKANVSLYSSKRTFFDPPQGRLTGYVNALAMATTVVGNCDVWGAIGPDFSYSFITGTPFSAGFAAEIGLRYHRYKNFSIGFAASDHYYLAPRSSMSNMFDLRIFLSKSL